jgi:hypothetical protein
MNRHSEMVTAGGVSIGTYIYGSGPAVVASPSYGRDGGEDFEPFTVGLAGQGLPRPLAPAAWYRTIRRPHDWSRPRSIRPGWP